MNRKISGVIPSTTTPKQNKENILSSAVSTPESLYLSAPSIPSTIFDEIYQNDGRRILHVSKPTENQLPDGSISSDADDADEIMSADTQSEAFHVERDPALIKPIVEEDDKESYEEEHKHTILDPIIKKARFVQKHVVKKIEDIGFGMLGVSDLKDEKVEISMESKLDKGFDVVRLPTGPRPILKEEVNKKANVVMPHEVQKLVNLSSKFIHPLHKKKKLMEGENSVEGSPIDILGTQIKDIKSELDIEKNRGTNRADTALNTPWILMVFPVMPLGFMYAVTAIKYILPFAKWTFKNIIARINWRVHVFSTLFLLSTPWIFWDSIRNIQSIRKYTLQIEYETIGIRNSIIIKSKTTIKSVIRKVNNFRFYSLIKNYILLLDSIIVKKYKFSLVEAAQSVIQGWYTFEIQNEITYIPEEQSQFKGLPYLSQYQLRLEFLKLTGLRKGGFKKIFIEVWLRRTEGSDIRLGRTPDCDVILVPATKCYSVNFYSFELKFIMKLARYLKKHCSFMDQHKDIPITLKVYANNSLPVFDYSGMSSQEDENLLIGEVDLSAKKIGLGLEQKSMVISNLKIPISVKRNSQYMIGLLEAKADIVPIENVSFSYVDDYSCFPNGDWTIRVHLIELRHIKSIDSRGVSNPYVAVTAFNETKYSETLRQTLSALVSQVLYFNKSIEGKQLMSERIKIAVMHEENTFSKKVFIGSLEFDVLRIYNENKHQITREWYPIFNPATGEDTGFLKLTIQVLRPGKIPSDIDSIIDIEEYPSSSLLKNAIIGVPDINLRVFSFHLKLAWAEMLPQMEVTVDPWLDVEHQRKDYVRGFCTVAYNGQEIITGTFIGQAKVIRDPIIDNSAVKVSEMRRVIWNEEFVVPLITSREGANSGTKTIAVTIFHRTQGHLNTLIASTEYNLKDFHSYIGEGVIRGDMRDNEQPGDRIGRIGIVKPSYKNFYGNRQYGASDPQKPESAFRGRLYYAVSIKKTKASSFVVRPCKPLPRPPIRYYHVSFLLLRLNNIPRSLEGSWIMVQCSWGLYTFGHTLGKAKVENGCAQWDIENQMDINNLQFPSDFSQVPDIFINVFYDKKSFHEIKTYGDILEEETIALSQMVQGLGSNDITSDYKRFGFLRLPANSVTYDHDLDWFLLDSLDGEARGDTPLLLFSFQIKDHTSLPTNAAVQYKTFDRGVQKSYTLKLTLYQGEDLPAADPSGLSDPLVEVVLGEKRALGRQISKQTRSPLWDEFVVLEDIVIYEKEPKPLLNIFIRDYEDDGTYDYLGRCIINIDKHLIESGKNEKSKWYNVFTFNANQVRGRILLEFQFVEMKSGEKNTAVSNSEEKNIAVSNSEEKNITVSNSEEKNIAVSNSLIYDEKCLRLSIVGIRDMKFLRFASGSVHVEAAISGDSVETKRSSEGVILYTGNYDGNCCILDILLLGISLPDRLRFAPALNVYVYVLFPGRTEPEVFGTLSVSLRPWLRRAITEMKNINELLDDNFGMKFQFEKKFIRGGYYFPEGRMKGDMDVEDIRFRKGDNRRFNKILPSERVIENPQRKIVRDIGVHIVEEKSRGEKSTDKKLKELFRMAHDYVLTKIQHIWESISLTIPDVALRLGLPQPQDPLKLAQRLKTERHSKPVFNSEHFSISKHLTGHVRNSNGFCSTDLEEEFRYAAYSELEIYRGEDISLGTASQDLISSLERKATLGEVRKALQEQERTRFLGKRPSVGKLKVKFDLIDLDTSDDYKTERARLTSLRSFYRLYKPTSVLVRLYVLRGINLHPNGVECNAYLNVRFFGGSAKSFSTKQTPILNSISPEFFTEFETEIMMPGGFIRIDVKDRNFLKTTIPITYPKLERNETKTEVKIVSEEIPVNIGRMGLAWTDIIGSTSIDLDNRWYNETWRSLTKPPVELRSLWLGDSVNPRGKLELLLEMIDSREYHQNPIPFRRQVFQIPARKQYQFRLVVFNIADCWLPYYSSDSQEPVTANFYIKARLGNEKENERVTDVCKFSPDGSAAFNWRMAWWLSLPDDAITPRIKIQLFNDTKLGLSNDDLCGAVDMRLRGLFDQMVKNRETIIKKRQWIHLYHPNYQDAQARVEVAVEFLTEEEVNKKKCNVGVDSYSENQHEDYILERPLRPKSFNILNPNPFFEYLIKKSVQQMGWNSMMYLLLFPFVIMLLQFIWMTPWEWYFVSGTFGLIIFLRLLFVDMRRSKTLKNKTPNTAVKPKAT